MCKINMMLGICSIGIKASLAMSSVKTLSIHLHQSSDFTGHVANQEVEFGC